MVWLVVGGFLQEAYGEATFAGTIPKLKAALVVDKTRWLEGNVEAIRADLETGGSRKLWALVRSVSGRIFRGARVAAVLQDETGRVLMDDEGGALLFERVL